MTVGIKIHGITTEIGHGELLHAYFSTISYRLENDGWGTRFPVLMDMLYLGELPPANARIANNEILEIKDLLSKLSKTNVIWDIDDSKAKCSFEWSEPEMATSVYEYFVTNAGRNLTELILEYIEIQIELEKPINIIQYTNIIDI